MNQEVMKYCDRIATHIATGSRITTVRAASMPPRPVQWPMILRGPSGSYLFFVAFSQRPLAWLLSRNDSLQWQSGLLRETSAGDVAVLWPENSHTPAPAAREVAATGFLRRL